MDDYRRDERIDERGPYGYRSLYKFYDDGSRYGPYERYEERARYAPYYGEPRSGRKRYGNGGYRGY